MKNWFTNREALEERSSRGSAKAFIRKKKQEETMEYYPYDKEKELIRKVRNGDGQGSRAILNDMLGHIFFDLVVIWKL